MELNGRDVDIGGIYYSFVHMNSVLIQMIALLPDIYTHHLVFNISSIYCNIHNKVFIF